MRFHKLEEFFRTPIGMSFIGIDKGSADFAQLIHDAQKFYVGDVCILEGIAQHNYIHKLPYPICIFEFQDVDPKGKSGTFFLLCEDVADANQGYDLLRVHSFVQYPTAPDMDDVWLHNGWIDIDRKTNTYDSFVNKNTLKFLDAGDGFDRIADANTIEQSIVASSNWLCIFLSVLNCSNVELTEVDEPKRLNKKRQKNGKVPIYSYKVLMLKTRQQRLATGNGTHESPRIHLRRGHIKRRKTGNFWWEPCVVGERKKGVVMKDYNANGIIEMH